KKRFRIDTIIVGKTRHFDGLADSLAYNGKEKKVYGPYGPRGGKFLVQLLSKAPNQFYHVGQIFIDTSIFRKRLADSIGDVIVKKIAGGSATFEEMAQAYSMGGEAQLKGDLGWIARGLLMPTIEHEMLVHKKGDVFKVWTRAGLHIMKKLDDPKQDTGFALMLQVFL
ncbi:MAG TPA: peptidylprolyl isomerase, partial [Puia sp.]|nr:peptidylprolyl isomerase [Puia sp.]